MLELALVATLPASLLMLASVSARFLMPPSLLLFLAPLPLPMQVQARPSRPAPALAPGAGSFDPCL